ncbi:MAG: DoxX family membrane protein [Halobacteriaceae archaeon]
MAIEGSAGAFLLAGRGLFALTMGFLAVNHFTNVEQMAGYAGSKGVPAPAFAVVASGVTLALGALSILTGAYATFGAGATAVFFLVVTPMMHDFWAASEDQKTQQMQDFMKNAALLGGALALLAISGQDWAYAVNVGLF